MSQRFLEIVFRIGAVVSVVQILKLCIIMLCRHVGLELLYQVVLL